MLFVWGLTVFVERKSSAAISSVDSIVSRYPSTVSSRLLRGSSSGAGRGAGGPGARRPRITPRPSPRAPGRRARGGRAGCAALQHDPQLFHEAAVTRALADLPCQQIAQRRADSKEHRREPIGSGQLERPLELRGCTLVVELGVPRDRREQE